MNVFTKLTTVALALIICVVSQALAGGDKSAKTTVITLAGGGEKQNGNYIPIPIPVCAGKMHGAFGGGGHGGHGAFGGYHGGHHGAQARMGWRR